MYRRFLRALSLLLCLALMAAPAGAVFADVPADTWFFAAVNACADKGYVTGVGDSRFDPHGQLTYAQVFTMLSSVFYKAERQDYETNRRQEMDACFGGAPQWWSYHAFCLHDKGLLEGTGVSIQSPASVNSSINRYEMVQIIANILADKGVSVSAGDRAAAQGQISDWSGIPVKYQDAVAACFSLGIVSGCTGGSFTGTDTLTRAQACVILNSLETVLSGGSVPVEKPDIPAETALRPYRSVRERKNSFPAELGKLLYRPPESVYNTCVRPRADHQETAQEAPMEKDVVISIKGMQEYEGMDPDCVELVTEGRLLRSGGGYTLIYEESELTGLEGTMTTIQVDGEQVTLLREGEFNSQMVFQKGRRHLSMYNTPYGAMAIGVNTHRLSADLSDQGGSIEVDYSIEVDHALAGHSMFRIHVKEAERGAGRLKQ